MTTITRLNDVDAKLAKRINGKLRVYSDGSRVHVLHWKSGAQCSLPYSMDVVAKKIRETLEISGSDYSAVVPALAQCDHNGNLLSGRGSTSGLSR